ncbi:MAG TPA: hypothetical protein VEV38_03695 [Candidatus Eremiobacteraceae bacterium]|nr:hypothetical protein [Candidatus Eremiobacteraceae bacterium]
MPQPDAIEGAPESVNLNGRIPKSMHSMLRQVADELQASSVNQVVNAVIAFTLLPQHIQMNIADFVRELRRVIDAADERGTVLFDASIEDWEARAKVYLTMNQLGLIEDLSYRQSTDRKRTISTFRVTSTGRLLNDLYQRNGLSHGAFSRGRKTKDASA